MLDAPVSLSRSNESGMKSDYDCPCVTINGPEALTFPEDGLVTFRFKRGVITARSASKREKASASVTLELTKLCDIEEAEAEENTDSGTGSPIDDLFKKATYDKPEDE